MNTAVAGCVAAKKRGSVSTLQVAGLDRLPVVVFGSPGCVFEEFLDFRIEGVIEIRSYVFVAQRFLNGCFDDKICHAPMGTESSLIRVVM